jgi:protein-S-isoprenylcysteine O-methyltransferase Ste14
VTPLPFVWPYWLPFWAVVIWAYIPEIKILRNARKPAGRTDSPDAGSFRVITIGGGMASLIAFPLAWVPVLRFPAALAPVALLLGAATIVAASLLRRHCFRLLGTSFTGDVRAEPGQTIVTRGAYALLRHPSYSAGILMNIGTGLALGGWACTIVLGLAAFAVYSYRIAVEERALLVVVGDPYREFIRTRKRLIPFIY